MSAWKIIEVDGDREWPKDNRAEVEEALNNFSDWELEVESPTGQTLSRQEFLGEATDSSQSPEIVEEAQAIVEPKEPDRDETEPPMSADNVEEDIEERMAEGYQQVSRDRDNFDSLTALAENPIEWLESKNAEYVNNIRGKDAISKRGFRYIQFQFGISTKSELVKFSEDPLGVIVWARAEGPGGRTAEAHGEGYQFESDLNDNEFVRYADTRAKNRAIADLTASGALAAEEMKGHTQ